MSQPLRLRANDSRDLEVVSTVLQDALVARRDMSFLQKERRFVMLANRFRWESAEKTATARDEAAKSDGVSKNDDKGDVRFEDVGEAHLERVHALLTFDRVERVETRGLPSSNSDVILNLLAIQDEGGQVLIAFSDDTTVRLSGKQISCYLSDVGDPWPTAWQPEHRDADATDGEHGEKG